MSDEWRKKSNALEVNVECDLRTERVSFVEPTTARASEPYQTRSSTTNMECDQQDRIENVEREGAELCTVIKVVAADVHDELPHLQAQTLLNASNEHGSKDDRREGEEGSCAAVEVTADVHKEVPHHTTLTGDVDQGSESTPLLVEVTLGSHQKGSSPQTELVPAQIQVALGLVLNSAPDCTLGAALDASANCTLPEQTEALADPVTPYDIHVNHLQATPPEPDMPQETENAIVDCNVMSPTTQGKTDHLFVIGDTSVITTVGVGHADQSIREVPSDLNMTVGCKGQVDSTSEIIPLLNTVA